MIVKTIMKIKYIRMILNKVGVASSEGSTWRRVLWAANLEKLPRNVDSRISPRYECIVFGMIFIGGCHLVNYYIKRMGT